MSRTNRNIESGAVYDLCLRVRSGLPFAALQLIALLLKSAVARANRDHKVDICCMVWMGSHVHFLIRVWDAAQFKDFYMEVQKKITDTFKRLLGVDYLNLWEGEPVLSILSEKETVMNRLVYFYLNPVKANLEESIDKYPGVTSWNAFLAAEPSLSAEVSEEAPWIQQPAIRKLTSRSLTAAEDTRITTELRESATTIHTLTISPNAWMGAFGISAPEEIAEINNEVLQRVRKEEEAYAEARLRTKKRVVGSHALRRQVILRPHTPKKRERRVYVQSVCVKTRTAYIAQVHTTNRDCRALYQRAKRGESVVWPPGVFPPPIPPLANALFAR